jgi:hypothetical protein
MYLASLKLWAAPPYGVWDGNSTYPECQKSDKGNADMETCVRELDEDE